MKTFYEKLMEAKEEFRDAHVAPSSDDRPIEERMEDGGEFSLWEVARGFHNQPDDFFRNYNYYNNQTGRESQTSINNIIRGIEYYPDRKIIAYRAVPNNIKNDRLVNGDWITFSKTYADNHGSHRIGIGEYKIIQQEIDPKFAWWDNNDINEWGYDDSHGEFINKL